MIDEALFDPCDWSISEFGHLADAYQEVPPNMPVPDGQGLYDVPKLMLTMRGIQLLVALALAFSLSQLFPDILVLEKTRERGKFQFWFGIHCYETML